MTVPETDAWGDASIGRVAAPLREQVIEMMRSAILGFQLRPGQRLIERELIERFGVSRTTVREAIRDLAAEGLITVIPQKGAIVSMPSHDEAADLYDIRAHLESLAVQRFVARATDEEVDRLQQAVDELSEQTRRDPADTQKLLEAKDHFYEALITGAGSAVLRQVLVSLQARVRILRATSLGAEGRADEAAREIRAIMSAVERRDADEASRLSILHIQNAAKTALRELPEDGAE
ncbi:GntR family transcriptional regulator [Gryllotalpicola koreensis]|uniref:GntR family transcriptional regulator n=1 Tax=Gryllotalpicola koreensis TaxID=993086 RepID=A0ABP7ZZM4_9MICO